MRNSSKKRHFSLLFMLFCGLLAAQRDISGGTTQGNVALYTGSRIQSVQDNDSSLVKITMAEAAYSAERNFLPYYPLAYTSDYNLVAEPTLTVKKAVPVSAEVANILKKYYSELIHGDFTLYAKASLSRGVNLNHYHLIPFRLSRLNQFEELVDYDISWQLKAGNHVSAGKPTGDFALRSVLASGDWYKIGVTQSGVHKLTKEFLSSIGLNTNNINPKNIHIYGNGGKMLPERNKDFRYDDLQENAIKVIGEEDGKFDNADYILFYASGVDTWYRNKGTGLKFKVTKNLYSDTSFYFIHVNTATGKRIGQTAGLSAATRETETFDYYNYHEENVVNFGKSGRDFYGEFFDYVKSYQFKWNDNNFVTGDSLLCDVSLVAINTDTSNFRVSGNGLNFVVTTGSINPNLAYEDYAKPGYKFGSALNSTGAELNISIDKLTSRSIGYLDKITVNARRQLVVNGQQFTFRDSRVVGNGKTAKYKITNLSGTGVSVWNISNPLQPVEIVYAQNGNLLSFVETVDSLQEYCAAPMSDYYTPAYVGKVSNQNLHGILQSDYLIITHPIFEKESQQLGAFHQQKEGLSYQVVTTDQIYNEFSSGRQDISAIRDFIRMVYSRTINTAKPLKYVVLMGRGSYINQSRSITNNSNLIPTYQSINSLSETQSLATDDFYALMDPDEGQNAENFGSIDLSIGRLICKTSDEMKAVLNKIYNYYKTDGTLQIDPPQNAYVNEASTMGDWRNNLLFLADDEDGAEHMKQSNSLTTLVNGLDANYNVDKVYLDAYQRFSTAGGARYPDASGDFVKRILKGALLFNYTGHGGEVGLTAERIIDVDIINSLNNFNKLPLFVTATCEFSRYDDPARTSAGELCLLNAKGGAIALFTTCRVAYSGPNFTLNSILLTNIFSRTKSGGRPTLGDIVQMTKSDPRIGQSYVYANFHLLGDPALTLTYPKDRVFTTQINQTTLTVSSSDTLKALSKITVKGYVGDNQGNKLNFNGLVYPTVFDKEQDIVCLMNTEKSAANYPLSAGENSLIPFQFKLQKNILYRGKTEVKNGDFSFTFIVPKDISFAYGPGRISYYATTGNSDANGYYSKIIVGGASSIIGTDNEGPQVKLYMNDPSFVNGGITNENPVMFARLVDSSGINTVGTGLGHDISAILDAKSSNPIILNDYYESDLNSYQSGRVRYPFSGLSDGEHNIAFKVWDIQNNSNTVYTDFVVAKSADLALTQVLNYPNPFSTHTQFMFQHNQTCVPLKVTIQVYTVSGKLVKTIQQQVSCDNGKSEAVDWDGKDDYGQRIGRGVYIYKLSIMNPESKKAEKIEKLVILN